MSRVDCDVLIAGGGVVGSALALALARTRLQVMLVEARPPEAFDPAHTDLRVFALSPASAAILARLGAWPQVLAMRACVYHHMRVWESGPDDELAFDAGLIGSDSLGWIVEDRVLRAALFSCVQAESSIDVVCPAAVTRSDAGAAGARVELDDGRRIHARLVVAADGVASPLREAAGIPLDRCEYGERAVVAHVRTSAVHQSTAWQRFTTAGTVALLPLADGRSSVVWSLKDARATAMLALDDAAFCAALEQALGGRIGSVLETSARAAFPLRLQLAHDYVAPRLALVGDAAHVFHPLAGQGLNLGLLDAAALAEVLADAHAERRDIGSVLVLAGYAAWRRGEVARAARTFELLDGLFRSDFGPLPLLRRLGLRIVQRSGPLKRELALHASGFAGRVPALAQRLA